MLALGTLDDAPLPLRLKEPDAGPSEPQHQMQPAEDSSSQSSKVTPNFTIRKPILHPPSVQTHSESAIFALASDNDNALLDYETEETSSVQDFSTVGNYPNTGAAGYEDSVEFAHYLLTEGDTLVFIDFPNTPGDHRKRVNCDGIYVAPSQCFRVHSKNLSELKESKFARMLDDHIYQARIKRRRKPDAKQMEGIQYLLDLTPPQEGDELVMQMMELSLTPGLINWWISSRLHRTHHRLVDGHDDLCACSYPDTTKSPGATSPEVAAGELTTITNNDNNNNNTLNDGIDSRFTGFTLPPTPDTLLTLQAKGQDELYETPHYRRIPDYCPFRHCNGIIRMLMIIEGKSVRINSAPRLWTLLAVSKFFDCQSVVRDRIAQWILQNPRFIEVLPEEALRIGFNLQLPQITQSAFRILVNELAIREAADEKTTKQGQRVTAFGRKLEDIGDEHSNIIQHAARAFIERLKSQFEEISRPDVFDLWDIPQWKRLRQIEHVLTRDNDGTFGDALDALRILMEALPRKLADRADFALNVEKAWTGDYGEMDRDRATYVAPKDFQSLMFIMAAFNSTQRLLCPFFYRHLSDKLTIGLFSGQYATHPNCRGKKFPQLVRELEAELQAIVNRNPRVAYDESWSAVFDDNGPFMAPLLKSFFVKSPLINLYGMETDVLHRMEPFANSWVRVDKNMVPPLNITRHMLLTLNHNEMKYLPLWAGGNDDGTGGVFEESLPPAVMGPNGPGPAYHTGLSIPSAPPSLSGSLMEEIREMNIRGSTIAGSVDAQDSISTVYRPDHVIAAGSSVGSESFTENNSDFENARFAAPADHQGVGQTIGMLVDSMDEDSDDTLSVISAGTEIAYVSDIEENEDEGKGENEYAQPGQGDNDDGMEDLQNDDDSASDTSSMVLV